MKKSLPKKKKKVIRRKNTFKTRGFSKVMVVGIVALVLVAGGVFFFMSQQKGGGSALPSLVKPALNPNCELKDPELCKFVNNMMTNTEYAVTTTSEYGGMKSESLMEISGEGKFHMVTKQNGKEISNMISIDDTMYTLDYTDNKWAKLTLNPEVTGTPEKDAKDQYTFKEEDFKDNTTYKFIAKEACGDKNCFKYEMISPDSGNAKMFIWFDDSEYLMRKMLIETQGEGSSESVYTYGGVNISVPSPVKEGQPNGYGGGIPNASDPEVQKMMQEYQNQMPEYETPIDTTDQTTEEY